MATYKSNVKDGAFGYTAPFIGNGNMTLEVDFEGTMNYKDKEDIIKSNSQLRIWWAGRRFMHKKDFDLVSFGCFGQSALDKNKNAIVLKDFEQCLDTYNGLTKTNCNYENDVNIKSEIFVHNNYNLIAIKKDIENVTEYNFEYYLCSVENKNEFCELFTVTDYKITKNGIDIEYKIDAGMYPYKGIIRLFSQEASNVLFEGNKVTLSSDKSNVFYILFCDSVDTQNYIDTSVQVKNDVLSKKYDNVKREHSQKWNDYNQEGYAEIDNEQINTAYQTAQYHLKCFTTNWSIPVGLNNGSWQGRYFAFDEFYMFMGLITSNHLEKAYKVPKFRYDGLGFAAFKGSEPKNREEAHYPWETLENGEEGAPHGFWLDHVFHMACIACDEYYYYKFTNDKEFLENMAYPVIKKCATYYMKHMLYHLEGSRCVIGKCTDLERLGASRENAYMTTCGVIKTFEIFNEVANLLGVDKDFADQCAKEAIALKNSLPQEDGKYIPYPGCDTASIALISGTYPFDVIERDSALQENGIKYYLDSENKVGNMYSVGTGVCSWYMTWKALVFARHFKKDDTYTAIKNAAKNTGYFGEMYEISDLSTKTIYRPWFTTAAGMLVHSVNEMLMQYDDDTVLIAPALPKEVKSFSFKLAAYNDTVVSVNVKDSVLEDINVYYGKNAENKNIKIKLPKHITAKKSFDDITIE